MRLSWRISLFMLGVVVLSYAGTLLVVGLSLRNELGVQSRVQLMDARDFLSRELTREGSILSAGAAAAEREPSLHGALPTGDPAALAHEAHAQRVALGAGFVALLGQDAQIRAQDPPDLPVAEA